MAKFRKKPVVIEAHPYTRDSRDEVIAWCGAQGTGINDDGAEYELENIVINTLEGDHRAALGDWIIKGVQGEFYPVKDSIFWETYEKVSDLPDTSPPSPNLIVECEECGTAIRVTNVVDRRAADELAETLGDLAAEFIDVALEGKPRSSQALGKARAALSHYTEEEKG